VMGPEAVARVAHTRAWPRTQAHAYIAAQDGPNPKMARAKSFTKA
jgi:hypothetical protein